MKRACAASQACLCHCSKHCVYTALNTVAGVHVNIVNTA
jgi:hypothetical protein